MRRSGTKGSYVGRSTNCSLCATTTLTLRWLIPRLSGFQFANPGIEIRLTTSNETGAALGSELDVILRQASGDIPGCIVAWTLPLYRIPAPARIPRPAPAAKAFASSTTLPLRRPVASTPN